MIPETACLAQPSQPSLSNMVTKVLRELISQGPLQARSAPQGGRAGRGAQGEPRTDPGGPDPARGEGHVELRRHRGAFVSQLTRVDVEEVHTLRAAIERLAAERACVRMGPPSLPRWTPCWPTCWRRPADVAPEEVVRLDLQFHDIIYSSCDHQRVQRVWTSIRSQVSFFLHTRNVAFPDFAVVGHSRALRAAERPGPAIPPPPGRRSTTPERGLRATEEARPAGQARLAAGQSDQDRRKIRIRARSASTQPTNSRQ